MTPACRRGAAICGGLLLVGCTAPVPPPASYGAPVIAPPGWEYRDGSYYPPPATSPVPVPEPSAPVGGDDDDDNQPAPAAIPKPRGIIPQAHAAEPTSAPADPPSASADPAPLIDIIKSPPAAGASPDDACIGAWRICHLF